MSPALTWQFGPVAWAPSWVALAVLTLLAGIVAQALFRARRRLAPAPAWRRHGITALNLLAFIAVAALLAPPEVERPTTATVTLLTEGTAEDAPVAGAIYATTDGPDPAALRTQRLRSVAQLPLRHPDLDHLELHGHGLAPEAWSGLPSGLTLAFDPPALEGPVEVRWPAVLDPGQPLTVTGVLRLPEADAVGNLRLLDPAGVPVASDAVRSGKPFALTTVPRASGHLNYRLQLLRSDAVRSDDPLDVFVRGARGARLLVLQSAPSFETRQLTAWAADRGQPVVVRTQISRDRDLAQGMNLPEDATLDFGPALLEASDLAVLDGRRWASLDAAQRSMLLDAVRDGLGLMLLADETLAEWLTEPQHQALLGVRLAPLPSPVVTWPRVPGSAPERPLDPLSYRLEPITARRLLADEDDRLLEAWQPIGDGRLAVSVLRGRHGWATSGERSSFARYWTRVLQRMGRPASGPRLIAPDARQRPRPAHRLDLCAEQTPGETLPLRLRVTPRVPDPVVTELTLVPHGSGAPIHCAPFWPLTAGAHRLQLLDAAGAPRDESWISVYGPDDWRAHDRERRQAATLLRMEQGRAGLADRRERNVRSPLSPWWAWGLLLLAGGGLWVERRLAELD